MKRTRYILITMVVLLVMAVTIATAATNPDDSAQENEYTVKWGWTNSFRCGDFSTSNPILVKVGSGEFASVASGEAFVYKEGDIIEVRVKLADCYQTIRCDAVAESNSSTATVVYGDEYVSCTLSGCSGNLDIFLIAGEMKEGYFPVEYRDVNSLVSEFYTYEGMTEFTLTSPDEFGFARDGLTFVGWKDINYSGDENEFFEADSVYALPDVDFNAIRFEAIWSCGVMDCEDTDEYPLWVNGVKVTETNHTDIFGDGTVSYDALEKILTFNNADFCQPYRYYTTKEGWVASKGDLTVKGNVTAGYDVSIRVYDGTLICDELTIKNGGGALLYGSSGLILKGKNVNLEQNGYDAMMNFRLISDGDVTFSGAQMDIWSLNSMSGDLVIEDSELEFVEYISQLEETWSSQKVTIKDSKLTISGAHVGNVIIQDSDVTVSGSFSNFTAYSLHLIGSSLSVSGDYGAGVNVMKTLTVEESEKEVALSINGTTGSMALMCNGLVLGESVSVRTPANGRLYTSEWDDVGYYLDADGQAASTIMIVSDSAFQVVLDYTMINALDTRLWGYEDAYPGLKKELFVTEGTQLPTFDWKEYIDHPDGMLMDSWITWLDNNLTFEGWYKDRQRTEPFDFSTPITENTVLYGKWSDGIILTEEDYLDIETSFPDEAFRTYVKEVMDVDADGKLTPGERSGDFVLKLSKLGIEDLTGVNYFTNTRELYCNNNKLADINIGDIPMLSMLDCSNNLLQSIDVSNLTQLASLNCARNQLTGIKVHSSLYSLDCSDNKLESLDFLSELTWFGSLNCANNLLTELDFSGENVAGWELQTIDCTGNKITSLDLSRFPNLMTIYCSDNQITDLKLCTMNNCYYLNCSNNNLSELNLDGLSGWWDILDCSYNQLTGLLIPEDLYIQELHCNYNKLTSITVGTSVSTLSCINNLLTSIYSISGVENLYGLDVSNNPITEVDLTGLNNLTAFTCCHNELSSVKLDGCPNLRYLCLVNCGITSLDVSMHPTLETLSVWGNKLTSLNLDNFTNLYSLFVSDNQLTELVLPREEYLKNLTWLDISYNDIESFDISACTNLKNLACLGTKLTALDISQNKELEYLYADSSLLSAVDFSGNPNIRWISSCDEDEEEGCVIHIQDIQSEEDNSYDNLTRVEMGGVELKKDIDYWTRRGSTIITFSDAINEKLQTQSYEIKVYFTENDKEIYVSTNVKAKETEPEQQNTNTEVTPPSSSETETPTPAVDPGTPGTSGETETSNPASSENQGTQSPESSDNQGTQQPTSSENQETQQPTSSGNQETQQPTSSGNQETQQPTSSGNQETQQPTSSENQGTQSPGSSENQVTQTPTPEPTGAPSDKPVNTPTPTPKQDSVSPSETPSPTPTEVPITPIPTETPNTPTPTVVEEVKPTDEPTAPSTDENPDADKVQNTDGSVKPSEENENKENNQMLWIVLAIVLGAGVLTTIVVLKKSNRR